MTIMTRMNILRNKLPNTLPLVSLSLILDLEVTAEVCLNIYCSHTFYRQ